jgi:hypothetical protein
MGGGTKKRRQRSAERQSSGGAARDRQEHAEFKGNLDRRRGLIERDLPETMEKTRVGAEDLRRTGGFNKEDVGFSDLALGDRGREGYTEFSETGGFSPGEREAFLRRSTAPSAAIYGHQQDELSRRLALQGGYMPGFGASQSRLTRQAGQEASKLSLGANLDLAGEVRAGRELGLRGLERTRDAAGIEKREQDRIALDMEREVAKGRVAGQELLQKYTQFGLAALDQADIRSLQSRLQSGNMSQADAQLLERLAAQDRSLYDNIIAGAGAAAGIITAATPVPTPVPAPVPTPVPGG